jgi:hypothetical protein
MTLASSSSPRAAGCAAGINVMPRKPLLTRAEASVAGKHVPHRACDLISRSNSALLPRLLAADVEEFHASNALLRRIQCLETREILLIAVPFVKFLSESKPDTSDCLMISGNPRLRCVPGGQRRSVCAGTPTWQ